MNAMLRHEARKLRVSYAGWVSDRDIEEVRSKIRMSSDVLVSQHVSDEAKTQIILFCAEKQKTVYMVPQFYELAYARFRIVQFYDTPTFMVDNMGLTYQQRLFKRTFDFFFYFAIIVTLPIQILAAIAVKLDSKGPVFYIQERNTIHSRIYNVIKFRPWSIKLKNVSGLTSQRQRRRLTRVGKVLRNMHNDELLPVLQCFDRRYVGGWTAFRPPDHNQRV
jgi:hypothetical protein